MDLTTHDRELNREASEPKRVRRGYSLLGAALISLGMWGVLILLGSAIVRWVGR